MNGIKTLTFALVVVTAGALTLTTCETADKISATEEGWPSNSLDTRSSFGQKLEAPTPAIETYERVVLEGARVSISCPHSTIIEPTNCFGSHHRGHQLPREQQKQFAPRTGTNDEFGLTAAACSELEQVKWFRNHVPLPLLSPNHFRPSSGQGLNLRQQQQQPDLVGDTVAADPNSPNWTSEFSQTTTTTTTTASLISDYRAQANQFETFNLLQTKLGQPSANQNVNELVSERKLTNVPPPTPDNNSTEETLWRVNQHGELIINRASQYFAGKYTCLFGGRQSEVLLDVLAEPVAEESRPAAGSLMETDGKMLDNEFPRDEGERPRGSEQIEKEATFDSGADTNANSLPDHSAQNKEHGDNGDVNRLGKARGDANSQVVNNSSPGVDPTPIATLSGQQSGQLTVIAEATQLEQLPVAETQDKSETGPMSIISDPGTTDEAPGSIQGWRQFMGLQQQQQQRHHRQRPQIHLVKSEVIQTSDLKSVPGFLYTKQQLYCPISGLTGPLQFHHIQPLVHRLCPVQAHGPPESLVTSLPPTERAAVNEHKEQLSSQAKGALISCYRQAERLIRRLIARDARSHGIADETNCSSSILDLVWFKDGLELEFDASGRALNTDLNVKLINSAVSSSVLALDIKASNGATKQRAVRRRGKQKSGSSGRGPTSDCCLCTPEGRTLEIDGIRRESAGRYTCAWRLSLAKFEKLIQNLRLQASIYGNDKSPCCDREATSPLNTISALAKAEPHQEPSEDNRSRVLSFAPTESTAEQSVEAQLADRAALLQSIMRNGSLLVSQDTLAFVGKLTSGAQMPLRAIQSFSLVVVERSANSCDLWSTIQEAGYAYARRKLADFKRLKRNINGLSIKDTTAYSDGDGLNELQRVKNVHAQAQSESSPSAQPPPSDPLAKETLGGPQYRQPDANQSEQSNASDAESDRARDNEDPEAEADDRFLYQGTDHDGGADSGHVHGKRDKLEEKKTGESFYLRLVNDSAGQKATRAQPLLNYSDRFESASPTSIGGPVAESRLDQTNIHTVKADEPFNYANERASQLLYATAESTGTAISSAPTGSAHDAAAALRPQSVSMIKGNHEYLASGTKDLITQKGHQGIIDGSHEITKFQLTSEPQAFISNRHPMVIDSARNELSASTTPPPPLAALNQSIIDNRPENEWNQNNPLASGHEIAGDLNIPIGYHSAIGASYTSAVEPLFRAKRSDGINEGTKLWHLGDKLPTLSMGSNVIPEAESISDQMNSQLSRPATPSRALGAIDLPKTAKPGVVREADQRILGAPPGPSVRLAKVDDHQFDRGEDLTSLRGEGQKVPFQSQNAADPLAKPVLVDDRLDEGLLWTAGQYLYMHMRALAASSIFGVEVAVEWSNERSNGTNIDIGEAGDVHLNTDNHLNGDSDDILSTGSKIYDAVPFATIDVISGQSLQLQCTAQALGRLPEVKWYKRIDTIPDGLRGLATLVRKIGYELYWPLTDLDILDEYIVPRRGKSFVCSQTTAIFDNLANQTFTVISSLKLSQYNDFLQSKSLNQELPPLSNNYNLYACIVDADVRHHYATLGVHFREKPSDKISSEISKRLQARSALNKPQDSKARVRSPPMKTIEVEKYTNFDFYRENQLQFPLKTGYWIPIQNSSSYRIDSSIDGYPLTPTMLATVIVIVFSSLLALMYLTLRTYRNLTQNQLEEDLINQLDDNYDEQLVNVERSNMIQDDGIHTRCLCQFEHQSNMAHQNSIIAQSRLMFGDDLYDSSINLSKTDYVINNDSMEQVYYQAHAFDDIQPQCVCHARNVPIIGVLPSNQKSDYSYSDYQQKKFIQQHVLVDCCQSTLFPLVSSQSSDRPKVNLVNNPLVGERIGQCTDQNSLVVPL